jgi:hypothetical protein
MHHVTGAARTCLTAACDIVTGRELCTRTKSGWRLTQRGSQRLRRTRSREYPGKADARPETIETYTAPAVANYAVIR